MRFIYIQKLEFFFGTKKTLPSGTLSTLLDISLNTDVLSIHPFDCVFQTKKWNEKKNTSRYHKVSVNTVKNTVWISTYSFTFFPMFWDMCECSCERVRQKGCTEHRAEQPTSTLSCFFFNVFCLLVSFALLADEDVSLREKRNNSYMRRERKTEWNRKVEKQKNYP